MAAPAPAYRTNPMKWDSDGDGLSDGQEASGGGNPAQPPTNPTACDTDGDGLGDLLELGIQGRTGNPNDPCTPPDSNTGNPRPGPTRAATAGAGTPDGIEDANRDGDVGIPWTPDGYCGIAGETDPADADTDDDGVGDLVETSGTLTGAKPSPYGFDTAHDGLSDGLEQGVTSPLPDTLTGHTVLGAWPTWQPWQGVLDTSGRKVTTDVLTPDSDHDGMLDGLEDGNHNGKSGAGDGELDAKNADSDGDGIADGRELLVYATSAPSCSPSCYSFAEIYTSWGDSLAKTNFDPGNPFQTNPRDPNTDGGSGDMALDGNDID